MCRDGAAQVNMLARNIPIGVDDMGPAVAARLTEVAHERPRLSDEARVYLSGARTRFEMDRILLAFEAADKLKILFVGETIIDEYRYVTPLAKPSKEFILATVEAREPEQFLGGVVAASLHGEWKNTTVVTDDGEPIKKTRFVEDGTARKVFEVYNKPRLEMGTRRKMAFLFKLTQAVNAADAVIVFDFGHGLMSGFARDCLAPTKFLAVNAQTNAGNYGFNPVTNYPRADLVCIDLPEAQLATRLQNETSATKLSARLIYERVIITHGRQGCYCPQHVPAFGSRAIDTMGAGDAFLAVTAPLVAAGLDLEAAAFVGNVAGAIKTDIVGHRRHVGRDELLQAVEGLLA